VSSSCFSKDVGWSLWHYKKSSNPSNMIHITFQSVSMEALSRRLMLSQTASELQKNSGIAQSV
jgi:hypothetical protein